MKLPLQFVAQANSLVLDILFPKKCLSCKNEGAWLCKKCASLIQLEDDHVCPICEKMITPDGKTCLSCKRKSPLSALIVASSYKSSLLSHAIHLYKYRFVSDLHLQLGDLLIRAFQKTDLPLPELILPVPLHPRRLRWRGFNQSFLLTKHISENLLPHATIATDENILIRKRYTLPQMGIKNYANRQKNIADAFSIMTTAQVKDKRILLVDDVATTGSTILECAKILKQAGAKEVFAIVIARQATKNNN